MSYLHEEISPELSAFIKETIEETPYYQLLGMTLNKVYRGFAEITLKADKSHTNPIGLIHGGVIMSIADAAMGNSVRSLGIKAVTIDMSTSFLDSAKLEDNILAVGKVIKAGKQLFFVESFVYANEKVISHSKGTFYKIGEINL